MSYIPSLNKNYDMSESGIDDRVTALEADVAALDKNPVVPSLPTAAASYQLKVSGSTTKTYEWDKVRLPAVPTTAGQYALKVVVSGQLTTYSWVDVTPAAVENEPGGDA